MRSYRHRVSALPWVFAFVGLAVPMIGNGFIGWPLVVGWLVVLLMLWWTRPLAGADQALRITAGIAALAALGLLATLGGLYLMPALIGWVVLEVTNRRRDSASVIAG